MLFLLFLRKKLLTSTPTSCRVILMSKKSFVGTCQACFAQQVAKGSGEPKLVLHGYSRPGDGFVVGDCAGHGQLPYELSCEFTKNMRTLEEGRLNGLRIRRAEFANAEVVKLYIEIPNPDYNWSVRETVPTTKTIFITPEYKGEPGTFGRDWFFFPNPGYPEPGERNQHQHPHHQVFCREGC